MRTDLPEPALRRDRSDLPVALVSMPFMTHFRPSIQIGLLAAIADEHGFEVTTFHSYLDFAAQVGRDTYEVLRAARQHLRLGDWLFAVEAFGDAAPDHGHKLLDNHPGDAEAFLAEFGSLDELMELREVGVPAFLDRMMAETDWGRFAVVGFSCTFEQNTASFALARRIKAAHPHVVTLFGGANFDGEMGLETVRSVDCIDYAVVGEGDVAFPAFLAALAEGGDPADVPGVTCRRDGAVLDPRRAPLFRGLDELPFPDFDEYFDRAEQHGLFADGQEPKPEILVESSRGCWWGQKHHCTFCGLNALGMAYRTKSAARVRADLDQAAARYPSRRFFAVDAIMDMSYLKDLLPGLAADGAPYELFYEMKANLTRAQIKLMRDAGMGNIQPGIESLSTHVLALMRKGITAIQNVNTIRWATHYGLDVTWNILCGFPGETPADYEEQERLLDLLHHLPPPGGTGRLRMDRYSPLYDDRASFPVHHVAPMAAYSHVYPEGVDLWKVAYAFDHEFVDDLPDAAFEGVQRAASRWRAARRGLRLPTLTYRRTADGLSIADFRDPAAPVEFVLAEPMASAYEAFSDRPTAVAKVAARLDIDAAELDDALDALCADGLVMREGRLFLSLALPADPD
ncbi:MAG: RiPP maturation radical SAM C-methyltransferase [Pseudonocardia sp.]